MRPEQSHETYLAHIRALEESGELYPCTVEIIFPPQVKKRFNRDGLILPVSEVLEMCARDIESDDHVSASELRAINEEFYLPFDEGDEDSDDNEDSGDNNQEDYGLPSAADLASIEEMMKLL